MSNDNFKWVDVNLKGELPVENMSFDISTDGKHNTSSGTGAGIYGGVALLKTETQLSEKAKVGCSGPSADAALGVHLGPENSVAAMVEPSLVKVEGEYAVTENANLYGSTNMNNNTGIKVNKEGFKLNILGFGLTAGIGGKYTFDTPVGSFGASANQNHTLPSN